MGAEAGQKGGERLDRQRRDDERHAEPERIDGKQTGALGQRRLGRRDRKNGAPGSARCTASSRSAKARPIR